MGLPKAVNAGELPNVDVPESVTYSATMDGDMMTLVIECGTGVFGHLNWLALKPPLLLSVKIMIITFIIRNETSRW